MRFAIAATVAVVVAAGASIVAARLLDEELQTAVAGFELGPDDSPLAGGKKVSLEEATARFDVPIYRPDMPLASDDSIRDIWMNEGGGEALIYMRYTTGVVLKVGPPAGRLSTEEWAEALTGDGIDGTIEGVTGVPAFVVTPHYPSLGSVRFFLRDVYMVIIGDGEDFTTDQLRDLAISAISRADAVEADEASVDEALHSRAFLLAAEHAVIEVRERLADVPLEPGLL
jgi:hypothetical protein